MKRVWIIIAMLLLSSTAFGGEEQEGKRFMPLDAARRGGVVVKQAGLLVTPERRLFALSSDNERLQNGFMRIDRARSVAVVSQKSLPSAGNKVLYVSPDMVKDIAPESEEIADNGESSDPVLVLFGGGGKNAFSSFAQTMRDGKYAASGLARHRFWPLPDNVKQYVSSGYGIRTDPFHGRRSFHGGIDIAAPDGAAVIATADGQVAQVGSDANYGRYITLQHDDGTFSRYGHLSAHKVTHGQHVRAGQTIGAVGATGRASGAHLDYRISRNGETFDPLAILTVPSGVAVNTDEPVAIATTTTSSRIAQNRLPRAPMLIKVQ